MKTEDLQAKGLSQEQIDFVMAENGKDVNAIKAERDGYKTQLDTAQASLKAMEGVDAAGLQTKVTELTDQLQGKDDEIEKIKADYAFDASLKEAIRKAYYNHVLYLIFRGIPPLLQAFLHCLETHQDISHITFHRLLYHIQPIVVATYENRSSHSWKEVHYLPIHKYHQFHGIIRVL